MPIDWTAILVATIPGAVAAVIVAIPAGIIAWRTHTAVNSRMDKFLKMVEEKNVFAVDAARVQATLDEKDAAAIRQGEDG